MILAPRDPKQCGKILSYFMSENLNAILMSDMDKDDKEIDVIFVDTMGELSKLYAVCDIAFIGGSMVKQGGHNPLEPAAFAKPVLFGDDMSDFLLVAKMLTDNKGSKIVESEMQLQQELETILNDKQVQEYMGKKNFEIFSKNSGSVQKIIKKMEQLNIV
jgi:3-deoxy-D-manno-octulosonic-acid transferase